MMMTRCQIWHCVKCSAGSNICDFSVAQGPMKYLEDLEEWRHENRGLALLLTVDSLIRKKVSRLMSDHRKKYTTFSKALLEVLENHKQLWNDARSSAELDKFKQAGLAAPTTPPRGSKRERSTTPPKRSAKARKNKAKRERTKELLKAAKANQDRGPKKGDVPAGSGVKKDARIPSSEWQAISAFKSSGKRRCPWFNCSLGCRFGDQCKNEHSCVECGKPHPWHGNH